MLAWIFLAGRNGSLYLYEYIFVSLFPSLFFATAVNSFDTLFKILDICPVPYSYSTTGDDPVPCILHCIVAKIRVGQGS